VTVTAKAAPDPTVPAGTPPRPGRLVALRRRLAAPTDVASLAAFRVMFGALVVWEVYRYAVNGWVDAFWVQPDFHFGYLGFGWVEPLPAAAMWALFGVLGAAGVGIAVGACYRLCAVVFTDRLHLRVPARAGPLPEPLLPVLPAGAAAGRRSRPSALVGGCRAAARAALGHGGGLGLWLLRAQVAIVYVYGGLAKLNGDWLAGEPLRTWLAARPDFPVLGRWFDQEWMVYATSYGGLLLDLLVVPAVLWHRTRIPALAAALAFHLVNRELFNLGVFPYLAMAALLLWCAPSWPRDLLGRVGLRVPPVDRAPERARPHPLRRAAVVALAGYLAVQLLVPLRHHLYAGDPSWTEAGHWFAWRMMLREKWGEASFTVHDPSSGQQWRVDPATVLAPWQEDLLAIRPELIRQFSHELARRFRAAGHHDVEVFAHVRASLNGREPQPLVDPRVDLASQPARLGPHPWVPPLAEPLTR
jgi:vitamin K-dependent gamma-carboxylase